MAERIGYRHGTDRVPLRGNGAAEITKTPGDYSSGVLLMVALVFAVGLIREYHSDFKG